MKFLWFVRLPEKEPGAKCRNNSECSPCCRERTARLSLVTARQGSRTVIRKGEKAPAVATFFRHRLLHYIAPQWLSWQSG
ncbi:MAG: hypothetical protein QHH04_05210 [Methanolinea sp.]|nr:hypothetical protein [Methanolinea sp.]